PRVLFERVWENLVSRGNAQFWFATQGSEVVAGLILLRYKSAVTYWSGCSVTSSDAMAANSLLLWETMLAAKQQGDQWFEVGPVPRASESTSKMDRIGRFKNQCGGEALPSWSGRLV